MNTNKLGRAAWNLATFSIGAYGFIRQVTASGSERPFLLAGCLMLMGFPIAQYLDLIRKRDS